MMRTIVSLPEEDKRWLDQYSHRYHQSTAQTIRFALEQFKKSVVGTLRHKTLRETAGLFKGRMDSVKVVRQLRREWDR